MDGVFSIIFYVLTFLALYVQVFFLVTFLERRKEIVSKIDDREDHVYPKVTVIVPAWNEEKTLRGTVESLLGLDYPKNKIQLILIDDGSTDNTYAEMQKFANQPNIQIIKKENGGKHTAMNLGIKEAETEFISCLDADSFVTPSALKRMMPYFDDPSVMAVSPSIIVDNPKSVMEWAQKIEYQLSIYIKKMLGLIGGIHVTPGPFSIYRTKVFRDLGDYRYAHKTEDMEIAYRMQEHGYRIEQCHDAIVHTKPPKTAYALYKQRLRWIYGFINNTIDYRRLIFRKKYGTIGLFTIPAGIISIFAAIFLFLYAMYSVVKVAIEKIIKIQTVGLSAPDFSGLHFDWFFISTKSTFFIAILIYGFVMMSVIIGSKMSEGKTRISLWMIPYIIIYSVIAPLWVLRAIFNTITGRQTAWR